MQNSKLLGALVSGAAAGVILGVLLAPQAGAETRKKILSYSKKSTASLEDLIEEGKKTWYETKGKAKMGAGIAADELDDFMRHILDKGQNLWQNGKNKAHELADEAEGAYDSAMNQGKKFGNNLKESVS